MMKFKIGCRTKSLYKEQKKEYTMKVHSFFHDKNQLLLVATKTSR